MKAFIIIEDDPQAPAGVSVNIMQQLTAAEVAAGVAPYSTTAGQFALEARDHIDDLRVKAFQITREIKRRQGAEGGKCWH